MGFALYVFVILCGLLLPLCLFTLNNTNEFTSEALPKLFILSILEDPINYKKAISAITSRSRNFFYYFVADFFFLQKDMRKKWWPSLIGHVNECPKRQAILKVSLYGLIFCLFVLKEFFIKSCWWNVTLIKTLFL